MEGGDQNSLFLSMKEFFPFRSSLNVLKLSPKVNSIINFFANARFEKVSELLLGEANFTKEVIPIINSISPSLTRLCLDSCGREDGEEADLEKRATTFPS